MKQAKAMVFKGIKEAFEPKTINIPELLPGEVLVKIDYSTICTSDLHTQTGRRISPCPSVLGHEIIGTVTETGQEVMTDHSGNPLKAGDRITWSVYAYDRESDMAKKGIPQKSAGLFKYGHQKLDKGSGLSGGFATHCVLKKGTAIFKLDDSLSLREAAPLNCTHATIAGAYRLAGSVKAKNVLVIGAGMLGLSACAMAKNNEADQVFVMDINTERMEQAKAFGADQGLKATAKAEELIEGLKDQGGIDVVIDTTGVPEAMELALELLNIGGIMVWVGAVYSQRKTQIDAETVVRKLLTIKGLHNYAPEDLEKAITFVQENRENFPFNKLVGREFSLEALDEAFGCANTGEHYRVGIVQE